MINEIVCASVPNLPIHIGYSGTSGSKAGIASANHFHDEIELLRIIKGRMSCTINENTFEISCGDVAFINSRVPHYTSILEDGTTSVLVQINIDAFATNHEIKYLSRFINNREQQYVLFKADEGPTQKLSKYIDDIKAEHINKEKAYEKYIKANIYNILALLYRENVLIDAESFFDIKTLDKVLPILQYIHNNYQESINLEKISSLLNLNQYYFCRLFKKATNSTFTDYLNFVRICRAEKLLSSTQKNVMEISLETGFSSVSYFNRTFKKFKNCAPTAYRKIKYAQK